tara:strand:+ start:179 stop:376 length:198 start_codon:yes stop_codon:yes gene_type:complete
MNDFLNPNWNKIIKEFHLLSTKICREDLSTASTVLISNSFSDCVLRNAPNEAQELIYKLKDLILN